MSASKESVNTSLTNSILESFTADAVKEASAYNHPRALEIVDKIDGNKLGEIAKAMGIEGNFPSDAKEAFKLALQKKFTSNNQSKGREQIYGKILSELFPNGIPETPEKLERGMPSTIYLAGPFGIDKFAKLKEIMSPESEPENPVPSHKFFHDKFKKSGVFIDFEVMKKHLPEYQENLDKLTKAGLPENMAKELAYTVIRAEASGIAIAAENIAKSKNMTIFSGDSLVTIPPEELTPEYLSGIEKSNQGRQVVIYGMVSSKIDINTPTDGTRYHVDSINKSLANFSKLLERFPGVVIDANFEQSKENEKPKQPYVILDSHYVRKLEVKETHVGKIILGLMNKQLKALESGKEMPVKPGM